MHMKSLAAAGLLVAAAAGIAPASAQTVSSAANPSLPEPVCRARPCIARSLRARSRRIQDQHQRRRMARVRDQSVGGEPCILEAEAGKR